MNPLPVFMAEQIPGSKQMAQAASALGDLKNMKSVWLEQFSAFLAYSGIGRHKNGVKF